MLRRGMLLMALADSRLHIVSCSDLVGMCIHHRAVSILTSMDWSVLLGIQVHN